MDEVQLRIGDVERRDVDARLQLAVGEGQLTLQEYDERSGQVWAARTRAELDATVQDLPSAPPAPEQARPAGRLSPRRVLAVMSGDRFTGPLAPGQGVEAYAVMGGAVLDLRRDDLPALVRVRAVAVMGGVEVFVPRGATVQLSGISLMGGRDARVDPPRAGGPVVQVQGYALMGGVDVTHGGAPQGVVSLEKPSQQPVLAAGSYAVGPVHRSHRGPWVRRLVAGVAVAAVGFGLVSVATADDPTVFGSKVVRVGAGESRSVGMLFGSQTVVVPNDSRVESGGTVVFGSTECDACGLGAQGEVVRIRTRGAFGSVEIMTEQQFAADQQTDRRDGDQDDSD